MIMVITRCLWLKCSVMIMKLPNLVKALPDALKRKLSESAPAAGFDPELTARFYAGGLLALIRWWLSSGADVPDEVLLRHVEHFIPQPELPV